MFRANLPTEEKRLRILLTFAILGTAVLLWILPANVKDQPLAFLLIAVWPMLTWAFCFQGRWGWRLVAAGGFALIMNALLTLLLSYLPGMLYFELLLVSTAVFALFPLILAPASSLPKFSWQAVWPYLLVFLIALAFRLPNLSYAEFQGDEGVIMIRTASIIMGDDAELFLHQKGPIEILQPMNLWQLAGEINESWARALFTWASVLSILAVMALGWQWFGRSVGVVAALLLAITGFSIAFGRIVQYQSFVMLWGALALFHAVHYTRSQWRGDLLLTAVFLGGGLLAHYDAVLVVPAISWVLGWHIFKQKQFKWQDYLLAIVVGALTLAAFYLPFFLNPNFSRTGSYLVQDRIGVSESTGIFSWSGTAVWRMITLYNSSYFIIGLVLFIVVGIWMLLRQRQGLGAILYFLTPLLFYLFIVVDPRTHVYTFFPGAVILAAVGIVALADGLKAKEQWVYRFAVVIFSFWMLITAVYVYLLFIDNTPERMRTWDENQPSNYWVSWSEPPEFGLFGFPHQVGWRLVANLIDESGLPYASDEEQEITKWYMSQAPRTHCNNFNTFVTTLNTQDSVPYDPTQLDTLFVQDEVMVNGVVSMQIYGRNPVDPIQSHDATHAQFWQTPAEAAPQLAQGQNPINIMLGEEKVVLLGYDLHQTENALDMILYWQPKVPFRENHQTFVHLYDPQNNELIAQHDTAPECGIMPTVRWEPGQIIADPHHIVLTNETAHSDLAIRVGMYNLITGERLSVPNNPDNIVQLQNLLTD